MAARWRCAAALVATVSLGVVLVYGFSTEFAGVAFATPPELLVTTRGHTPSTVGHGQSHAVPRDDKAPPPSVGSAVPSSGAVGTPNSTDARADGEHGFDYAAASAHVEPGATCFPDIPRAHTVPDPMAMDGITFPALRYMLAGHCAPVLPFAALSTLASWKQHQHDMIAGKQPMQALVYDCHQRGCNGHGDRLRGIATVFWLAFVTNRAILINAVHPVPLADFYAEHELPWLEPATPLLEASHTIHDFNRAQFMRVVSGASGDYVRITTATAGTDTRHWYAELLAAPPKALNLDRLRLVLSLHAPLGLALDTLFRPTPRLLAQLQEVQLSTRSVWQQDAAVPRVCLHRRTGAADVGVRRRKEVATALAKLHGSVGWLLGNPPDGLPPCTACPAVSVYVASDDNSTASALSSWTPRKARGPSINFVQAPSPASFHVDQVPEGMPQEEVSQLFGQVVAEHLLLTMCTKWVVPKSGFSVGAVMWANQPDPTHRVLHYQSKPMSHNRRQATVTDIRAMPQHYFWQLSDDSFKWPLPPGEPELPTLRLPPTLSRVEIFKIGKKMK